MKTIPILLMSGALAVVTAGCASSVPLGSLPAYPQEIAQSETLDVQVFRNSTKIRMTNTTARSFGKSRLWANAWYGRDLESFGVGETVELDLFEFRDTNGEVFRAGGFFAGKNPDKLVLMQLQTGDALLGLVVVGEQPE